MFARVFKGFDLFIIGHRDLRIDGPSRAFLHGAMATLRHLHIDFVTITPDHIGCGVDVVVPMSGDVSRSQFDRLELYRMTHCLEDMLGEIKSAEGRLCPR